MDLTAIIKKGEKQYVALCPELDVVSQEIILAAGRVRPLVPRR